MKPDELPTALSRDIFLINVSEPVSAMADMKPDGSFTALSRVVSGANVQRISVFPIKFLKNVLFHLLT